MPGDDDNRIVSGGELNLEDPLEGVEVPVASTDEADARGSGKPKGDGSSFRGEPYTLDDSLYQFLENSRVCYEGNEEATKSNQVAHEAIGEMVKSIGSSFFSLGNLSFWQTSTPRGVEEVLTGELEITDTITFDGLKAGLAAMLGSDEGVEYLLQSDLGAALGLDDSTKEINPSDPQLQQYFPDIKHLQSLNARYLIPKDPYILLLAVEPRYRRFLSLCLDEAKEKKQAPFNIIPGPNYSGDSNNYGYSLTKHQVSQVASTSLITLQTMVQVGMRHQVKELKQYLDAIQELSNILTQVDN